MVGTPGSAAVPVRALVLAWALGAGRPMGFWLRDVARGGNRLQEPARARPGGTGSRRWLMGGRRGRCLRYGPGIAVPGAGVARHDCSGRRAAATNHQAGACCAGDKRSRGCDQH